MSLSIDFRPGRRQSFTAASYFRSVAGTSVGALIEDLPERRYLVGVDGPDHIALRIWSRSPVMEEAPEELLERLRNLFRDLVRLSRASDDVALVQDLVKDWTGPQDGLKTYFLEHTEENEPARTEEPPDLSLGVVGGRITLLSTTNVMFVQLQPDMFGLAVAGVGSYLIERSDSGGTVVHQAHRA